MKREAFDHTKIKRLCRRLSLPRCFVIGVLDSIWHLTSTECPQGDIGKLSNEDIALAIDYPGDENKLIENLLETGLLDRHPTCRFIVHDWPDHAEDTVHAKLARGRQFFANGQTPKLTKLSDREREQAKLFYFPTPASDKASEFQTGHSEFRNGETAADGIPKRQNGGFIPPNEPNGSLPIPKPKPLPKPTAAAAAFPENDSRSRSLPESENGSGTGPPRKAVSSAPGIELRFRDSAAAITERFPRTDVAMIRSICRVAVDKRPSLTDEQLCAILALAKSPDQKSAGLFLTTVPAVIENKLQEISRAIQAK